MSFSISWAASLVRAPRKNSALLLPEPFRLGALDFLEMNGNLSLASEDTSRGVGEERGNVARISDVQSVMTWDCAAMVKACGGQWATIRNNGIVG